MQWEEIASSPGYMRRAKVPGGWLVMLILGEVSLTFYPDPDHEWDGSSLP